MKIPTWIVVLMWMSGIVGLIALSMELNRRFGFFK